MTIRSNNRPFACLLLAAAVSAAADEPPDMTITFDANAPTYIDQSKSTSFPNLGYAGCIADEGPEYAEEFFNGEESGEWEVYYPEPEAESGEIFGGADVPEDDAG